MFHLIIPRVILSCSSSENWRLSMRHWQYCQYWENGTSTKNLSKNQNCVARPYFGDLSSDTIPVYRIIYIDIPRKCMYIMDSEEVLIVLSIVDLSVYNVSNDLHLALYSVCRAYRPNTRQEYLKVEQPTVLIVTAEKVVFTFDTVITPRWKPAISGCGFGHICSRIGMLRVCTV